MSANVTELERLQSMADEVIAEQSGENWSWGDEFLLELAEGTKALAERVRLLEATLESFEAEHDERCGCEHPGSEATCILGANYKLLAAFRERFGDEETQQDIGKPNSSGPPYNDQGVPM